MTSFGYDSYMPSSYKRKTVVRSGGYGGGGGGGIASRTMYSSHAAAPAYVSSSRRAYPSHSRSAQYSAPVYSSSSAAAELSISQAAQVSTEFKTLRTEEKAQLQDLNDRFASFIERVHELEQQKKLLETELLVLRQRHVEPSNLTGLYEQELRQLRAAVEEAGQEKQAAQNHRDQMDDVLGNLQGRYEQEVIAREDAEGRLMDARKCSDEAGLARAELEKRVGTLLDELAFLKRLCESEISELQAQVQYSAQVSVEMEVIKPDLSASLRDVRVQYEKLAQRNLQSAEEWFCTKMNVMTVDSARNTDHARTAKDEVQQYRRQIKARELEIDACREMNQALEGQLQEVQDSQSTEITELQVSIVQLEDELRQNKNDMARYLKEYQDLLNVKMALDIEIAAYRNLLEGEENRLSVGPSVSHYSQSMFSAMSSGYPQYQMQSQLSSATPYLHSYRLGSALVKEEIISASHAQQAEATQEEDQEEEEEEEEQTEVEEAEEDAEEEVEEAQGEEEAESEKDQEEKEEDAEEEEGEAAEEGEGDAKAEGEEEGGEGEAEGEEEGGEVEAEAEEEGEGEGEGDKEGAEEEGEGDEDAGEGDAKGEAADGAGEEEGAAEKEAEDEGEKKQPKGEEAPAETQDDTKKV